MCVTKSSTHFKSTSFLPRRVNGVRKVTALPSCRAQGRGSRGSSEQAAPEPCQPAAAPVLVRSTTNQLDTATCCRAYIASRTQLVSLRGTALDDADTPPVQSCSDAASQEQHSWPDVPKVGHQKALYILSLPTFSLEFSSLDYEAFSTSNAGYSIQKITPLFIF